MWRFSPSSIFPSSQVITWLAELFKDAETDVDVDDEAKFDSSQAARNNFLAQIKQRVFIKAESSG